MNINFFRRLPILAIIIWSFKAAFNNHGTAKQEIKRFRLR